MSRLSNVDVLSILRYVLNESNIRFRPTNDVYVETSRQTAANFLASLVKILSS